MLNFHIKVNSPFLFRHSMGERGSVVRETLCYKQEGLGSDSRCHWTFFFKLPNPSSRTMALGSTRPVTVMSTKNFYGG
jgi:hypothetical protein